MQEIVPGVFKIGKRIYTKSLIREQTGSGENIIKDGVEFRNWDPFHSKLASAIIKGLKPNLHESDVVLYLGAASGTTISHISDILTKGFVFGVEFASRVFRDLYLVAEKRPNLAIILEDANHPERYSRFLSSVDFLYQDIAQKNQVDIFIKNAEFFLKENGFSILCVKSRSIDVVKKPKKVFSHVRSELEKYFAIVDFRTLEPFQKDHAIFLVKR